MRYGNVGVVSLISLYSGIVIMINIFQLNMVGIE